MAIFYHGSSVYFESFDLAHALEGAGNAKFGYGENVSEMYASAAHYSYNKKRPEAKDHYVYTVDIPDQTPDNCLPLFKRVPVPASIVERAEAKLGETIPSEVKVEGIPFRKYLANLLVGNRTTIKQMADNTTVEAEKAASEFLLSIGVELIVWPYEWKKPEGARDMVVLDPSKIRIVRIDKVDLDQKRHLVKGSTRLVKEF